VRLIKFGWCVTGHHSDCRKMYIDWQQVKQVCDCGCHNVAEIVEVSGE
jgi:hypothetical protein